MELPKNYDHLAKDEACYKMWQDQGFFIQNRMKERRIQLSFLRQMLQEFCTWATC